MTWLIEYPSTHFYIYHFRSFLHFLVKQFYRNIFGYFNVEIYPKVIAIKDLKLLADLLNCHSVMADYVRANLLKSRAKA